MNKRIKKIVALFMVVLVFSCAFDNNFMVNAIENETSKTEKEKELVQCSDDWVIFRYKDGTGEPTFDIKYQDKTVEQLEAEGLSIEYRIVFKGIDYTVPVYPWVGLDEKTEIEKWDEYLIQFRLLDKNSTIHESEMLPLYRSCGSFPYILSANCGCYNSYKVSEDSHILTISLKVSEPLQQVGNLHVSAQSDGEDSNCYVLTHQPSNLTFENHSESVIIEDKTYTIEYSIVTFDVDFAPNYAPSNRDTVRVNYLFKFSGLKGIYTNKDLEDFFQEVSTPGISQRPLRTINLSSSSSEILVGNSITLIPEYTPYNATNKELIWSSNNENYATVNTNGVVTAKAEGIGKTVTITAQSADDSNIRATYTLNIKAAVEQKDVPVQYIKISGKVVAPSKVKISKVLKGKKKVSLKFNKVKNAKGYLIQYSTNKKFKGAKEKYTTKTKITIKKLKSKKVYYFRVKAYKLNGREKVLSKKWSSAKKVKIK